MTTQWYNHYSNNGRRRSFLLTNGEVVQEPELEESGSGLKLRLKGDRNSSFYKRDKEDLVRYGLNNVAASRKARFWMPIDLDGGQLHGELGFKPAEKRATFDPTSEDNERAVAWWSFKHPTMPIEGVLTVRLARTGRSGDVYHLTGKVAFPNTVEGPDILWPKALSEIDIAFENTEEAFGGADYGQRTQFEEWVRDNPAEWADGLLGTERNLSERRGVEKFLKAVQTAEDLDVITIPDLRDSEPAWLKLKLHDTNINGKFLDDIREFLDGSVLDRAVEIYKELVMCLRGVGMTLDTNLGNNEFMQALLHGDKDALTVQLGRPTKDTDDTTDNQHTLSVHLPSGTFVVSCSKDKADMDKVAHAWEESNVLASLTGRQDVLLAYAEEYVRTEHGRRTKKIVDKRMSALDAH